MSVPNRLMTSSNTTTDTGTVASTVVETRVSLLHRGQARERHLVQLSSRKAQENGRRKVRKNSRLMSITAFTMKNVVAAGDDHLANLLQGVAASINSPENLPQSEKNTLIIQAALGFWIHRHEAYGFRRWKESAMHRINLETLLAAGVDVHEEARQLLLAAETKRRMLTAESSTTDKNDDKSMRANFSSTESDLLLAWARHTQAKTFRGVDDNTVREALRYLRFRQYQDGEAIFYQGDKGDVFYVLLEGSVGIYGAVKRPQQPDKSKRKQSNRGTRTGIAVREKPDLNLMGPRLFTYRAGESFGETALFTNAAVRTATAIAFGAIKETGKGCVCELGELSRGVYSRTLKKFHQHSFTQAQCVNFAQRLFLFQDLPRSRVMEVAEVLELRRISFGGVLFSQGSSPLSHCYFILSGSVTTSTQLLLESNAVDELSASAAALKKLRRGPQLTIDLHTFQAGEIVALEALLENEYSSTRTPYSAVGASADVEVYAFTRADGKAFLATCATSVVQEVHTICAAERAHREERIKVARRALSEREAGIKKNRLKLENEALDLGLTQQQQCQRQKQQELEDLNKPSSNDTPRAHLELQQPFLPHLNPVKLLVSEVEDIPPDIVKASSQNFAIDTSLGEVAVPPKMLSTVVKNFVVRDWDTLSDDYAQRLTLQLPVRGIFSLSPLMNQMPTSFTSIANNQTLLQTHTARRRGTPAASARLDERRMRDLHMRQLSLDYDAKMHWDPAKKKFILQQALPTKGPRLLQRASSIALITDDHPTARQAEDLRRSTGNLHLRNKPL